MMKTLDGPGIGLIVSHYEYEQLYPRYYDSQTLSSIREPVS